MHRSVYMLMLAGAVALTMGGHSAHAADALVLKAQTTDADGRITLGDLFDNAGPAADVVVGMRTAATAVLDAGQVQAIARQSGQSWPNPQGLRRIIVTAGADGTSVAQVKAEAGRTKQVLVFTRSMSAGEVVSASDIAWQPVQSHMASGALNGDADTAIGKSVRAPVREGGVVRASDLTSPIVVHRADAVRVVWQMGGASLSMTGTAQKDGAIGDVITIRNPQSKKLIDAVVTGPGTAAVGEDAQRLRNAALYSSR
ncbi:MAG: flagellar basal body P-ring formation chaperone FlgA [Asticcacaulis sp.]